MKRPLEPVSATRNPCVRNCCLDDQDVCLGCGRTLEEITGWSRLSEEEREQTLIKAEARRKDRAWWS